MRRKQDLLVDFEAEILEAARELTVQGTTEFHGLALAKQVADADGSRALATTGKIYRALRRLEDRRCLKSQWEDYRIAEQEGRPRRRLYQLDGEAERSLRDYYSAAARRPVPVTRKAQVPAW